MLNINPNNLTTIGLTNSNFSGTAGTLLLAKFLQVFPSMKQLTCSDCSLTSADIIMLIHHLKSANVICKSLNSLGLSNNCIDDEGVMALTECLPELFPSLKVFNVGYQGDVILRGNRVRKELLHICTEHLKVFILICCNSLIIIIILHAGS